MEYNMTVLSKKIVKIWLHFDTYESSKPGSPSHHVPVVIKANGATREKRAKGSDFLYTFILSFCFIHFSFYVPAGAGT